MDTRSFRKLIREAVRSSEKRLGLRDRARLRIALWLYPEKLEQEIMAHAAEEGFVPADASVDDEASAEFPWKDFFAFIMEILPIILKALLV